jgi:Transposase DDE domain group 1
VRLCLEWNASSGRLSSDGGVIVLREIAQRLGLKPTVRRFHQLAYKAREWSRSRKLVARVEATDKGTDARFIVTNLEGRDKTLYEKVFCARGTSTAQPRASNAINHRNGRPSASAGFLQLGLALPSPLGRLLLERCFLPPGIDVKQPNYGPGC